LESILVGKKLKQNICGIEKTLLLARFGYFLYRAL